MTNKLITTILIIMSIAISFLIYYSQNFVQTLAKFTCDELAFLQNIDIILSQLFQGHSISPQWLPCMMYLSG